MILLDSDHYTIIATEGSSGHDELWARLEQRNDLVAVPLIVAEENMRGWLAKVARARTVEEQVRDYAQLGAALETLRNWPIAAFDRPAVGQYTALRAAKIRVGTMDLKIAATALTLDALLLTANRRDFSRVPNLRFDDWTGRHQGPN